MHLRFIEFVADKQEYRIITAGQLTICVRPVQRDLARSTHRQGCAAIDGHRVSGGGFVGLEKHEVVRVEGSDLLAAGLEAFQHHTTGRDGVGFQRNAPVFPVDPFAGVIVIGIGVRYVEGVSRGIEADLSDDIVTLGGCFVDVVGDFRVKSRY